MLATAMLGSSMEGCRASLGALPAVCREDRALVGGVASRRGSHRQARGRGLLHVSPRWCLSDPGWGQVPFTAVPSFTEPRRGALLDMRGAQWHVRVGLYLHTGWT